MSRRYGKELRNSLAGKSILGADVKVNGYPGLTFTASKISDYIPKCKIYVEPFAGLGRVAKHVQAEVKILNDMSDYAVKHLKSNFNATVTQMNFEDCIKQYDSTDTFFLIDPPWMETIYQVNPLTYCDRTALEYYQKLFDLVPTLKGDWIICCDKGEVHIRKICSKSGYYNLKIDTNKKLFGKNIGVLLTSNKPFIRHQQQELFHERH